MHIGATATSIGARISPTTAPPSPETVSRWSATRQLFWIYFTALAWIGFPSPPLPARNLFWPSAAELTWRRWWQNITRILAGVIAGGFRQFIRTNTNTWANSI